MTQMTPDAVNKPRLNPALKFVLELGPLVLFFLANSKPAWFHPLIGGVLPSGLAPDKVGMLTATTTLMVAAVVAASRIVGDDPPRPGGAGRDDGDGAGVRRADPLAAGQDFHRLKLTVVYCLLGGALLGAMAFGKLLLPIVLDAAIHIDQAGWRILTIRWGLFFFALAGLNEVLRQLLTWDQWVAFKSFGVLPITIVFAVAQAPVIMRHEAKSEEAAENF